MSVVQSCLTLCDLMDCSPARLFCPWASPRQNTGIGCHSLLQDPNPGIKPGSPALQADSLPSEPPGKLTVSTLVVLGSLLSWQHCPHGPVRSSIQPFVLETPPQQSLLADSMIDMKWLLHSGARHEGARHTLYHTPSLLQVSWFHKISLAHSKCVNKDTKLLSL